MTQAEERRAATAGAGKRSGVLSGHSSVASVSEVLGWLSSLKKSGVLRLQTQLENFTLQLQDGAVVFAQGDLPRENQLLGQMLVSNDALPEQGLEAALEAASRERTVLGAYLLRENLITRDTLARALARQAQLIFDRMFSATDATWRFEIESRVIDSLDMRLNVIQLLLESARVDDEHRRGLEQGVGVPLARAVIT